MALFIKQNVQQSQLQSKIAADLQARLKAPGPGGEGNAMTASEEIQHKETGKSVFAAGVAAMVVVALVIFVLFVVK